MTRTRAMTAALLSAALLLPLEPALAQDSDDLRVRIGLGGQTQPQYIGADGNEWSPLFNGAFKRGTEPFEAKHRRG